MDWWDESTKAQFEEMQACITNLYGAYTVKVKPNKTKVISADLLDFNFDLEDIFRFCDISVLVAF